MTLYLLIAILIFGIVECIAASFDGNYGYMTISALIVAACITTLIVYCNEITPMDVYQGKTTLEYVMVDGLKVDSCVILKK